MIGCCLPRRLVSILVLVDHAHRHAGTDLVSFADLDMVSILVFVDHARSTQFVRRQHGTVDDVSILVLVDHAHRLLAILADCEELTQVFRSLFSWITLIGPCRWPSDDGRCCCFDPCSRGSRSPATGGYRAEFERYHRVSILVLVDHAHSTFQRSRKVLRSSKFRSLFSWITLALDAEATSQAQSQARSLLKVSILVLVDHAHRRPGWLRRLCRP